MKAGILAALAFLFCVSGALARRDREWQPINTDPRMKQWFEGARDNNGELCCDVSDGYQVQARKKEDDTWEFVHPLTREWTPVPPKALLQDYPPSPNGGAAVWLYPSPEIVRCFVPPMTGL